MREAGFERHIGAENICANIDQALKRAEEIHNQPASVTAGTHQN